MFIKDLQENIKKDLPGLPKGAEVMSPEEFVSQHDTENVEENLHKWFKEKWVRFGPDGKIKGPCARGSESEGKPKCLPQAKAHSLGKKGRKYAAAKKRREDPNPERSGKAINVATKKKSNEDISRRGFLRGLGATGLTAAGLGTAGTAQARATPAWLEIVQKATPLLKQGKSPEEVAKILNIQIPPNGRTFAGPMGGDYGAILYALQQLNKNEDTQGVAEGYDIDEFGDDYYMDLIQDMIDRNRRNLSPSRKLRVFAAVKRDIESNGGIFDINKFNDAYKRIIDFSRDMYEQGVAEGSDWGEPKEVLADVMSTLERQVEWPLTDVMDPTEVQNVLQPVRNAINKKLQSLEQGVAEGFMGNVKDTELKNIDPDNHNKGEGDFVKNQLHTIKRVVTHLENSIGNEEDLPDWVQSEIAKATDKIVNVMDYSISKKEQDIGNDSLMKEQGVAEAWSEKYKRSINCSNPKGFSQRAHCQGRKKNESVLEEKCPHCGGPMFEETLMMEKKDACYYKVKSRYKVWPSAYASGALVKCRKKGAKNWGNKSESILSTLENLINEQFGPSATAAIQQGDSPLSVSYAAQRDNILGYGPNTMDEATKLSAPSRPIGDPELTDYLDRIRNKEKAKTDKYKLPYMHRSSVVSYYNEEGKKYNTDAIKNAIKERPQKLLKQNEKMKHSNGETEQFYNVGFAALVGIALDEQNNELIIVNTCPGAGSCKIDCFAMKGGKVQFQGPWLSDARILTFLLNDPEGFKNQLSSEIEKAVKKNSKDGIKTSIRWHDAGDFFSPEYTKLAFDIADKFPNTDFYAYTKVADVVLKEKPKNFIINWSEGAHTSQEKKIKLADPRLERTKNSRIVPSKLFYDLLVKDEKKNLVKGPEGQWQVIPDKLPELKQRLADFYGLNVHSILSYDEFLRNPAGEKAIWNVIVAPGEGDTSAKRHDVVSTLLLKH